MNNQHKRLLKEAMIKKFGSEIELDQVEWSQQKEILFLYHLTLLEKRLRSNELSLIKKDNFYISQKLINPDRNCILCKKIIFGQQNKIYLTKYKCCQKCYINHIEGRENKWIQNDLHNFMKKK